MGRETVAELEKLEVVDDGQGYPSVNHPIFTVQEERSLTDEDYEKLVTSEANKISKKYNRALEKIKKFL